MSKDIHDRIIEDLEGQSPSLDPSEMRRLKRLAEELETLGSKSRIAFNSDPARICRAVSQRQTNSIRRRPWWLVPVAAGTLWAVISLWPTPKPSNFSQPQMADGNDSPTAWLFRLDDESFRLPPDEPKPETIQLDVTHLSASRGVQLVFVAKQK